MTNALRTWRVPILTAAVVVTGALVGSAGTVGCGNQCDLNPDATPVRYSDGQIVNGYYESSGIDGPYLDFPPGRIYRFEHEPGSTPNIQGLFAFDTAPVPTSNDADVGSGTAPADGNQFTILRNTPTSFDVFNDTCSDVKLRIVTPFFPAPRAAPQIRDAGAD